MSSHLPPQVITLEGWVDIMYYVMDAHSFYNFIYFILLIIVSVGIGASPGGWGRGGPDFTASVLAHGDPCVVTAHLPSLSFSVRAQCPAPQVQP